MSRFTARPNHRFSNLIEELEARRLLSITPLVVEVPISAAAKLADPALNNYRSFDVRVTISAGDRFGVADMQSVLKSGNFYVPPDGLDADYPQKSLWADHPNLEFDTFICNPNFQPT